MPLRNKQRRVHVIIDQKTAWGAHGVGCRNRVPGWKASFCTYSHSRISRAAACPT